VTVVAVEFDPTLGLLLGAALVAAGSAALRRLLSTEPPPHPGHGARQVVVRQRGVLLLALAAAGLGAIFASAELTMVAFTGQRGAPGAAGVVLACFAGGSGVAGLVYGSRTRSAALVDRFRRQALIFAVLPVVFLAAVNVWSLAVCAFVVGLGIAPTLITGFGLVAALVPTTAVTEGTAWFTTGLSLGYGGAAAVVGRLADVHGARVGFAVTIAAGAVVGALALLVHRRVAVSRLVPQPANVTPR
jgi:hypothetical protein